jgi:hypothetical protein
MSNRVLGAAATVTLLLGAALAPIGATAALAGSTACGGLPAGTHAHLPTAGLRPLTATSAQLRAAGLPGRHGGAALPAWSQAMSRAKVFVCPKVVASPNETAALMDGEEDASAGTGYKEQSNNWAGNQDYVHTYSEAWMYWTVPYVSMATGTDTGYSVIWPGVGSGNSSGDELIQAGTKQYAYANAFMTTLYQFWYEIYPKQGLQNITNISVGPGDYVYADVWYTGTTAHFFLENESSGHYTSLTETFNGSSGLYAEWIVERPTINGSLPHLAFWSGAINLTDARAGDNYTNTYPCAGVQSHDYYNMYNSANQLLAYPSAWTDTQYCNFPVHRTGTP